MQLMESSLDSCVWHQFSNGDIKNPDITSLLFHQKRRLSLHIPAEDKFLLAVCPGMEQEEHTREYGEFSQSWESEGSPGHHVSSGTDPLVTMTTSPLGNV